MGEAASLMDNCSRLRDWFKGRGGQKRGRACLRDAIVLLASDIPMDRSLGLNDKDKSQTNAEKHVRADRRCDGKGRRPKPTSAPT